MLSRQIAEKIQAKVAGLVTQPLSVVDNDGVVLATNDPRVQESLDVATKPWTIPFSYGGKVIGHVVLANQLQGQSDIAPLIRSIAELIMHQSILIEQIPRQDERLDKFIYDLLSNPDADEALLAAEARLFDLDITHPRIAIVIYVDDPALSGSYRDPASDREIRIARYKLAMERAMSSYYTSSRKNIVAYLGQNNFCILKDLDGGDVASGLVPGKSNIAQTLENFKKSISTIYGIIKDELKIPSAVGVGNYHPGISGLRQSFNEATSATTLGLQLWDKDQVYHIDDFGVVAPLLSGVDESNIYFSRDLLDKLGQNSEIIQTLDTFFESSMSLTQTAEQLSIHRNTLVYRLDRIAETLSLDPRVFDDAVQIKLAILFSKFVDAGHAN